MEKKILFFICLILGLFYLNPGRVDAAFNHRAEQVSMNIDSDGYKVFVYDLIVDITGNTKINHISGELELQNLKLIEYSPKLGFVALFDQNKYDLTSNKIFTASHSSINYLRVVVKQIAEGNCILNFRPKETNLVTVNQFDIVKSAIKDDKIINKVSEGEEFQYNINVISKDNAINTDNVVVTDEIPSEFEIVDAGNGLVSGQKVTWNLGSVTHGIHSKNMIVKVRAKQNSRGLVSNTAILKVGDNTFSSSSSVEVVYSDMSILKKASQDKIKKDTEFFYTITFKNNGSGRSYPIIINDVMDNDLTFLRASEPLYQDDCFIIYPNSGQVISFKLDSMEAGETRMIKIYAKINKDSNSKEIQNTVRIHEEGKSDYKEAKATISVVEDEEVAKIPEVVIEKNVNKFEIKNNEEFIYSIVVKNNNDLNLFGLLIEDEIDSDLEIINFDDFQVINNTIFKEFDLKGNETRVFNIKVKYVGDDAKSIIKNKAHIIYGEKVIESNEVIVNKVENTLINPINPENPKKDDSEEIKNPQTGSIEIVILLSFLIALGILVGILIKNKTKLFRI